MKKKVSLIFLVLILVIVAAYHYIYRAHRDITTEKGSYRITAKDIFSEFQANEKNANAKYLDKTIEVTGELSNIDFATKSIVINDKLFATLKDPFPKVLQPNSKIKIKGRFIGYDALLEELKMDQCIMETP